MSMQSRLPFEATVDRELLAGIERSRAAEPGAADARAVDLDTRAVDLRKASDGVVHYVRHPRARRYTIRVLADGQVRVTIPRRGSRREATQFFEEQRAWIAAEQQRVAARRATMPLELPADLQRALRRQAARDLPARLRELADSLGLHVARISVRNQRRRWGSCSPGGHICLNWRLVRMPPWVRDYVLYHELMHLKRMDHSPTFWRLVADVCPSYREARAWLRAHGDGLSAETPV